MGPVAALPASARRIGVIGEQHELRVSIRFAARGEIALPKFLCVVENERDEVRLRVARGDRVRRADSRRRRIKTRHGNACDDQKHRDPPVFETEQEPKQTAEPRAARAFFTAAIDEVVALVAFVPFHRLHILATNGRKA